MIAAIQRMLGLPDRLTRLARETDAAQFAGIFVCSDVYVLAASEKPVTVDTGRSTEELLARVRSAAEELSRKDEFEAFMLDEAGKRVLPVFTSRAFAEKFAAEYGRLQDRAVVLQLLGLKGKSVASAVSASDGVVLNPLSPLATQVPNGHARAVASFAAVE